jgi:hypothetical protein
MFGELETRLQEMCLRGLHVLRCVIRDAPPMRSRNLRVLNASQQGADPMTATRSISSTTRPLLPQLYEYSQGILAISR